MLHNFFSPPISLLPALTFSCFLPLSLPIPEVYMQCPFRGKKLNAFRAVIISISQLSCGGRTLMKHISQWFSPLVLLKHMIFLKACIMGMVIFIFKTQNHFLSGKFFQFYFRIKGTICDPTVRKVETQSLKSKAGLQPAFSHKLRLSLYKRYSCFVRPFEIKCLNDKNS